MLLRLLTLREASDIARMGRNRTETFDLKEEALDRQAEIRCGIRRIEAPTLKTFVKQWEDEHLFALASGTRRTYEVAIRLRIVPELGNRKLDAITPGDVQLFLNRLIREGVGDASVRKTAAVLQSIFKRAEFNEFVSRNPVKVVKKP